MGVNSLAYARQLKALLPPGPLWNFDPGSMLSRLLLGIADELARIDSRAEDLLAEWDPRTATQCLADWERILGLPDGCSPLGATVVERRSTAARKLAARGGQTAAYFVELAALVGFSAEVEELSPHHWRLVVDLSQSSGSAAGRILRAGTGRAGDRLRELVVDELECVVHRAKPAHTIVWFQYLNG